MSAFATNEPQGPGGGFSSTGFRVMIIHLWYYGLYSSIKSFSGIYTEGTLGFALKKEDSECVCLSSTGGFTEPKPTPFFLLPSVLTI